MNITKEAAALAGACIAAGGKERPEVTWLKDRYLRFLLREGITAKKTGDRILYERMYGAAPCTEQDILKIRYWRTGRHLPVSHAQCSAFGQALGLDATERKFLLQGYYDGCDTIFEKESPDPLSVYAQRRAILQNLTEYYLAAVPPGRLKQLNIPGEASRHHIRHLYYTDALSCIHTETPDRGQSLAKHIISINYDSELGRNLKLLGPIPRKTMIRHLLILGMPDISRNRIDGLLRALGYLPLQADHTLRTGERSDLLLIGLLSRYEAFRPGKTSAECRLWMQQFCRALDEIFLRQGKVRMRFMYFKALGENGTPDGKC